MPDNKQPYLSESFAIELRSGPSTDGSTYQFNHRYARGFENRTLSVQGANQSFTALPALDFSMDGVEGNADEEFFTITMPADQLPVAYRIAGQFPEIECFVYQLDLDVDNAGASPTATFYMKGYLSEIAVRSQGQPNLAQMKFASVKTYMNDRPLGITATNLCPWRFGDTSCQALVHSYTGTVSAASGKNLTIAISGTSNGLTSTEAIAVENFFTNGFVTVEGLNLSIRDRNPTNGVFRMFKTPPQSTSYTWVGKTATVTEGCNKTFTTCGTKYDSNSNQIPNYAHFGGIGFRMPAYDPQTSNAQSSYQSVFNSTQLKISQDNKASPTASTTITHEWLPSAISPTAWYIADSISGSDGDSVAAWPDSSGNAHNAAQAVTARQPTLQTKELNNHSVVRFDGSNDIVSDSDIAALDVGTGDIWLACVFKSTDDSGAQNFFEKGATEFGLRCLSNGVLQFNLGGTTNVPLQSAGNWSRTEFVLATASRVSANANGFVNGSASTTTNQTNTGSISNSDVFDIGARAVGAGTLTGDIAEIIVGGTTLATADRLRLEGYLAHKYGLQANLPNDHTYRFKAP
jgi:hypothetical protein